MHYCSHNSEYQEVIFISLHMLHYIHFQKTDKQSGIPFEYLNKTINQNVLTTTDNVKPKNILLNKL